MNDRIKMNKIKGMIFLLLFVVLMAKSLVTEAQVNPFYRGIQASFSTLAFKTQSNISDIHSNDALLAGGQIGLHFGGKALRTSVGLLGYYSSVNNFKGTVDLYKNSVMVTFYPLALIDARAIIQPYITSGIAYDRYKFYGHYLSNDTGPVNYSKVEAPYLGSIRQVDLSVGSGITVKVLDRYDFVHFFAEALYGHNIRRGTPDERFAGTQIQDNFQVSAGLIFGARR